MVHVSRPQDSEVALVERCELGFAEALGDRENSRVDEADVRICVRVAQLTGPSVVLDGEVLDQVRACDHVVEKRPQHAGMHPRVDPGVDLDQYGRRDDERFVGVLDESARGGVVGIATVERGVQRARVEDQHLERGGGRSSPAVRAVSEVPDAPMPRLFGGGR